MAHHQFNKSSGMRYEKESDVRRGFCYPTASLCLVIAPRNTLADAESANGDDRRVSEADVENPSL
jgi:hypothetical protein